jgi:hypothetical protein
VPQSTATIRTGWSSAWTRLALAALAIELATGLLVTFAPFHGTVQWGLLLHTLLGLVVIVPLTWYVALHWLDYKRYNLSDSVLLGYVAGVGLLVCSLSGLVVTWQGLFGLRMSPAWRQVHLWSTWVVLGAAAIHVVLVLARSKTGKVARPALAAAAWSGGALALAALAVAGVYALYPGQTYVNELPDDYSFLYGEDRPFAPSLALTDRRRLRRRLAGQLPDLRHRGLPRADPRGVDAERPPLRRDGPAVPEGAERDGGAERARIDALLRRLPRPDLALLGRQERLRRGPHRPARLQRGRLVPELSRHPRDRLQGNANYVMTQPAPYLWQWQRRGARQAHQRLPDPHLPGRAPKLSKRMFKSPEYCAACHKQFIDQEVNRVGWVQLQNQYDNWKASHWYVEGDPVRTVECRECHMPLVDSTDPAAGTRRLQPARRATASTAATASSPPTRWCRRCSSSRAGSAGRAHRGVAPGPHREIPEIRDKWRDGPVVELALEVPASVAAGARSFPVRVVLTANKVGHDFPTGPLDIIQSWVELHVTDEHGQRVFSSGTRDDAPLHRARQLPVQGRAGRPVRQPDRPPQPLGDGRRALPARALPGYSDTVEYLVDCPATRWPQLGELPPGPARASACSRSTSSFRRRGTTGSRRRCSTARSTSS